MIKRILSIEGVKGVYHVADFLAVERNAKFDWQGILQQVREAFGQETEGLQEGSQSGDDTFGEVKVFVQMFNGIPMQVKLSDGEKRRAVWHA